MLIEWVVSVEERAACPTERDVVAHVTSIAGEALVNEPLRVRGQIVRLDEKRLRLELRVGSETTAPRIIEGEDCGYLADAAAFIVALDLQAYAEAEASAPSPPPAPPAPPPSVAPSPTTPAVRPAPVKRAPKPAIHGGLGADFQLDHASLPSLAWGGSIFGYATYRSVRAELGAALWPGRRAMVPGGGASVSLRTADLRACWVPLAWGDACARVELGTLRAAGIDIPRPTTSDGVWLAGLVGVTVHPLAWGPLRPRLTAELGAPMQYPTVTIEELGRVFRPGTPIVRLAIGIETRLF